MSYVQEVVLFVYYYCFYQREDETQVEQPTQLGLISAALPRGLSALPLPRLLFLPQTQRDAEWFGQQAQVLLEGGPLVLALL